MVEEACQICAPVCFCWSVWSLKAVQSDDACLLNLNTYSIAYVCAGAAVPFRWDWDWDWNKHTEKHLWHRTRTSTCYLLLSIDDPFDLLFFLVAHLFFFFYYADCFPVLSVVYCILSRRRRKFGKFFNHLKTNSITKALFICFSEILLALRVIGKIAKLIRTVAVLFMYRVFI